MIGSQFYKGSFFYFNTFEKLILDIHYMLAAILVHIIYVWFFCSKVSQEFIQLVFQLKDLTISQLKTLWQEASFKCRNDWSVYPRSFINEYLLVAPWVPCQSTASKNSVNIWVYRIYRPGTTLLILKALWFLFSVHLWTEFFCSQRLDQQTTSPWESRLSPPWLLHVSVNKTYFP